ncbi:hypothetical protein RF11_06633 [Thelohanellus kitauei]|uniref:Uncharacterized protein n=1 Tax=Thelohanellus kitauei TaxID=669202 RepID=A0A0C2MSR9_THEKT|nr:hypothetical protein RF11_06633 [Thelohanellus kitauei]
MNFANPTGKVYDEPRYINQSPGTRRGNDQFVHQSPPTILNQPERVERSSLDSTPREADNQTINSHPFIGANPNQNQQIPFQNYSFTPGLMNGSFMRTYGPSAPSNNQIYNSYYPYSQLYNSNGSSQTNGFQSVPPYSNNQGGNIWPISYLNPNTYSNHYPYPVENVGYAQNVRLESRSSVRQSNQVYINGGFKDGNLVCSEKNGKEKHKQGLICPMCKKSNDYPYYRRDLEMYICRYCEGGFFNDSTENRNPDKSRRQVVKKFFLTRILIKFKQSAPTVKRLILRSGGGQTKGN